MRRVLAKHYRPEPGAGGPSWLTFLGHSKDSSWSVDLFQGRITDLKVARLDDYQRHQRCRGLYQLPAAA